MTKRKLQLIAVPIRIVCSHNREIVPRIDLAYTCEGINHLLLFGLELLLVRDMLPTTPSAEAKMRASGRNAHGRGNRKIGDPSLDVRTLLAHDLYIAYITRSSVGTKTTCSSTRAIALPSAAMLAIVTFSKRGKGFRLRVIERRIGYALRSLKLIYRLAPA